jgi:dethiobiotin synthetase
MTGSHAWFVTGTDTGVGKTTVSVLLLQALSRKGMSTVGMKPVASGCRREQGRLINEDVERLRAASTLRAPWEDINPYAFEPAIAPHIAARQAASDIRFQPIQEALDRLRNTADAVVVEGAGGFRVPLGPDGDLASLCQVLRIPIILVVGMRLGCINHALLTVEAILSRGLVLAGWVANCMEPAMVAFQENFDSLKAAISAPCLGVIPFASKADPDAGWLNIDSLIE